MATNDDDITPEVFAQMVSLAALELGPDEGEYLRKQLNGQLKAVRELERIPIGDDVPPAAHGVPFTPAIRQALRADEAHVDAALAARILAQAPESDEGYFVVPEIPHTNL
jgi:aspartyl/glutamyl-tRNA(Asn/Gln) amidotransferase C subunit